MLLNRKQTGWVWVTLALAALAFVAYWFDPQAAERGHRGSNWVGLILGALALGIFVFCGLLSLKRKVPHWKIGRAQVWLQAHVWFGLLAVWLVALHAGFGMGGAVTTIIWVLTGLVTLSALVGLGLQQVTPRLLLHSVPGETIAQQLSRLLSSVPSSKLAVPPGPDPSKPAPWPKPPKAFDFTWESSLQEMAYSTVVYYAGVDGSLEKPCPAWTPDSPAATGAAANPSPPPTAPVAPKPATAAALSMAPTPAAAPEGPKTGSPAPPASTPAATTGPAAVATGPGTGPAAAAGAAASARPAAAPKKDVPPNGGEPLRRFWLEIAGPYFEGKDSVLEYAGKAGSLLSALKTMTPAHLHAGVDGLAYLIERRRQLVRQRRMQRLLVSWLLVHVPLSWALLVLAAVHAVMALRWSEVSL